MNVLLDEKKSDPVFRQTLANITGATIELYDTDGAQGAARGAAVGAGLFASFKDAFRSLTKTDEITPSSAAIDATRSAYEAWLSCLQRSVEQ